MPNGRKVAANRRPQPSVHPVQRIHGCSHSVTERPPNSVLIPRSRQPSMAASGPHLPFCSRHGPVSKSNAGTSGHGLGRTHPQRGIADVRELVLLLAQRGVLLFMQANKLRMPTCQRSDRFILGGPPLLLRHDAVIAATSAVAMLYTQTPIPEKSSFAVP